MIEPQSPRLPKSLPQKTITKLEEHQEYAESEISGCNLMDQSAGNVIFEEVSLRGTIFTGSSLPRLRLLDVRMEACDVSGAFLEESRLRRVAMIGCRLMGVQLLSAQLDDIQFKDCNLEGAVFVSSQTKALHFEDCILRNATFEEADLRETMFKRCDLTNADLRNTNLKEADLRGSTLDGLLVSPKDLQGALIHTRPSRWRVCWASLYWMKNYERHKAQSYQARQPCPHCVEAKPTQWKVNGRHC